MNDSSLAFCITKNYPNFSLECTAFFEKGITSIFGPSGSGKTTLLNCIGGQVSPEKGSIEVFGEMLYSAKNRFSIPPESRRFGYVFQDSALFPHMNVQDNICYGYRILPPKYRKIKPEQIIELFQLSNILERGISGLSGGERQKVALARALAISPRLLLLDEPLASVDTPFKSVIIKYLKRVWQELNIPIIYVSHSISEVLALAQEVLVLSNGKRIMQGNPSQVLFTTAVSPITNDTPLQNILDAKVEIPSLNDELGTLIIGNVRLSASHLNFDAGTEIAVSIDASEIILALDWPSRISTQNVVQGKIEEIHTIGNQVIIHIDIGTRLITQAVKDGVRSLCLEKDQPIYLIIRSDSIHVLNVA